MNTRNIVSIIAFTATIAFSGAAQAQYGDVSFPTITFADEFKTDSKTSAKAKTCKLFCKKSIEE